ncbi:3-dehydroquinate synthase [Gemmatimonas sp.]|uniref:3-dehydroquinate synthase n=1 Tax=Gemmatimonas sp. TaxID=1962908 RepID=UPI00286A68BA|nr:3-dehydroquinate synthase [Gemmatimonas sp.]
MGGAPPDALQLPLPYPVYCRAGVRQAIGEIARLAAPSHRVAVISDTAVARLHGEAIAAQFPADSTRLFTIPPGEQEKTRARWAELTDALLAWGAGRDTTVIAVGGGVIGDLAGFVASTYMRGLPVVQVPTTLLAMVDASVGGKTAVDTPFGKNLVGAFHNPSAVVIDPDVLATLPADVLRSGLAEMIKHGVIADASYFDAVLRFSGAVRDHGAQAPDFAATITTLITGSVRIKAEVVAEDTREGGLRQILNFGHTIAHAVERVLNFELLHGDAVAMGMVAEARIAESIGLAGPGLAVAIADAVERAGLPSLLPAGISLDDIITATHGDKKARAGSARYSLPRGIGEMEAAEGTWAVAVPDEAVRSALS